MQRTDLGGCQTIDEWIDQSFWVTVFNLFIIFTSRSYHPRVLRLSGQVQQEPQLSRLCNINLLNQHWNFLICLISGQIVEMLLYIRLLSQNSQNRIYFWKGNRRNKFLQCYMRKKLDARWTCQVLNSSLKYSQNVMRIIALASLWNANCWWRTLKSFTKWRIVTVGTFIDLHAAYGQLQHQEAAITSLEHAKWRHDRCYL